MEISDFIRKSINKEDNYYYVNLKFYQMQPKMQKIECKVILEELSDFNENGFSYDAIKIQDYLKFMKYLFPDCEVIDAQKYNSGHPDFIVKKGDEIFYVELKLEGDSLRLSQLDWIAKNEEKTCFILVLDETEVKFSKKKSKRDFFYDKGSSSILNFKGYDEPNTI